MPLQTHRVENALRNCRILVVEDDAPLAKRIAALFKEYTNVEPIIAHSAQEASDIVAGAAGSFGLAIVDVMLPETVADYEDIQQYQEIINHARQKIEEAGPPPHDEDTETALRDARYERAQALKQTEDLIDSEGGIKLVAGWRRVSSNRPAILYLTAVGSDAVVKKGLSVAGQRATWIVKPMRSEQILEQCANLLQENGTSGRG
jgi:DNA-binding response OmpR family regulator